MPLFLYFPLIIWMGLMGVAQDEMRVPAKSRPKGRCVASVWTANSGYAWALRHFADLNVRQQASHVVLAAQLRPWRHHGR